MRMSDKFDSESVVSRSPEDHMDQKDVENVNQRIRRNLPQDNQKQRATTKFTWSCKMAVDNDEKQLQRHETGAKFLTYGGRIMEKNVLPGNYQQ